MPDETSDSIANQNLGHGLKDARGFRNLLQQASAEIKGLRRRNELLNAQVEVVRVFAHCSGAVSKDGGQCMMEDIAWNLDRAAEAITVDESGQQADA